LGWLGLFVLQLSACPFRLFAGSIIGLSVHCPSGSRLAWAFVRLFNWAFIACPLAIFVIRSPSLSVINWVIVRLGQLVHHCHGFSSINNNCHSSSARLGFFVSQSQSVNYWSVRHSTTTGSGLTGSVRLGSLTVQSGSLSLGQSNGSVVRSILGLGPLSAQLGQWVQ